MRAVDEGAAADSVSRLSRAVESGYNVNAVTSIKADLLITAATTFYYSFDSSDINGDS